MKLATIILACAITALTTHSPCQVESVQMQYDQMVVVEPGEQVPLALLSPLPNEEVTANDFQTIRKPRWDTLGGHVEASNDHWVVYRAPSEEGPAFLLYRAENGTQFGVAFWVQRGSANTAIATPVEHSGYEGSFVPLMNPDHALSMMFYAKRSVKPEGQKPPISWVDAKGDVRIRFPDKPMVKPKGPNAPYPGRNCTAPPSIPPSQVKTESHVYNRDVGELTITYALKIGLEEIGITVTLGQKIKVLGHYRKDFRFNIEDCYACVDGQYQYVGSRVDILVCTYCTGYTPHWLGRALKSGVITGWDIPSADPLSRDYSCVSSGQDCPCSNPPTGSFRPNCSDIGQ